MRFPEEKMERFYPGVYTPEEQAAIDCYCEGKTGRMFGGQGPGHTLHGPLGDAALCPLLGPLEPAI